ncbi:transposase, partial [Parasutterella sp. NM82_D38]|nr:transposase [Parasutterella muris]
MSLALDSTSIWNKDEDNLPQINVLMLVDSKSGLPLFYRTYDGNVPDVQVVRRVIADNSRLGIQNVVLVSDRGYSGTKNINDCLRNKVGFLFNMKCGISGSLTQELIDEERVNLQDLNQMDWFTQLFQVTKKISWIREPNPVTGQRSTKKTQETAELYWHIYFDRQIAENARQGMFERIIRIREKMAAGKSLDENEQTLLEEVFVKHEKDSTV